MKLVDTDNFGSDYPNEKFFNLLPFYLSKDDAKIIADIVNKYGGENHSRYCKVVDNDYELIGGFES